jgi:hypothetical protein
VNFIDQSEHPEVRRALKGLRSSTAASLRAFNDALPHASWLRRSEIEHFTVDLLWAGPVRALRRRRPTPLGKVSNAFSWVTRARTAARLP